MFFNGEAIEVIHEPFAHTDGDSIVFFRRSDVVSTGDILTLAGYPIIDAERGGTIQGIIHGLNRLVYQITIPAEKQEGGTMVIPGHGRVCDQADVVYYQEMVIIIRDRIQAMIDKGMTVDQVKAAKPTIDYDPLYASKRFLDSGQVRRDDLSKPEGPPEGARVGQHAAELDDGASNKKADRTLRKIAGVGGVAAFALVILLANAGVNARSQAPAEQRKLQALQRRARSLHLTSLATGFPLSRKTGVSA